MGDTNQLDRSELLLLNDVGDSRADLNSIEDNLESRRSYVPGIFSSYNVNSKIIVLAIAITCFILTLALFIGTVIVFYGYSAPPAYKLEGCPHQNAQSKDQLDPERSPGTKDANSNSRGPDYNNEVTQHEHAMDDKSRLAAEWSVTKVNGQHVRPGQLVFDEEFNELNTSLWKPYSSPTDSKFYFYGSEAENSFVRDGVLYLKPTYLVDKYGEKYLRNGSLFGGVVPHANCVNTTSILCWKNSTEYEIAHPIMAPLVTTKSSFEFQYGRLVIRAQMPGGDWIEPVMSLQPFRNIYGRSSLSGEIHLTDTRGNRKLFNDKHTNVGSEQTCPDIRFGKVNEIKVVFDCLNTRTNEGFDSKFHNYELLWTPDSITIKIDDEGIVTVPGPRSSIFNLWSGGKYQDNPWEQSDNPKMAPFDVSFYLVFGIHVGGTTGFFHDYFDGPYPKPWNNDHDTDATAARKFWEARESWEPSWEKDASAMKIEYVKLYALDETTSSA